MAITFNTTPTAAAAAAACWAKWPICAVELRLKLWHGGWCCLRVPSCTRTTAPDDISDVCVDQGHNVEAQILHAVVGWMDGWRNKAEQGGE